MTETLFYRRAVGLDLRLSLCEGAQTVRVIVKRHGGTNELEISLEDATLLMRLSKWKTAHELGVEESLLQEMVGANVAFFSRTRPSQDLTGEPVEGLESAISLRRNAWATPVIAKSDSLGPFPFMPRSGQLRGAKLVGMHFGLMEMGQQVTGIGIACCSGHGMLLRETIAMLNGKNPSSSMKEEHRQVVELLGFLGLIEGRRAVSPSTESDQVTWFGHASVLVQLDGQRFFLDPLFHPTSLPDRESAIAPPDPCALPFVDAVLITHGDNDHFNPQALIHLDRETPVFIPKARRNEAWHVDMPKVLSMLGFRNVRKVGAWEHVRMKNVELVAVPFVGEDWGLPLPQLTWLVKGTRSTVYANADSAPMPDVVNRLVVEQGPIDLALLGVGGCEEAHVMPQGFGYGNFYADFLDEKLRNKWVKLCSDSRDAAKTAQLLKARFAFGYAAGGAPFIQVAYSDRGTHEELAELLAHTDVQPVSLPLGVAWKIPSRTVDRKMLSASPDAT